MGRYPTGRDEDGKIYDEGTRLTSNGIHFTVVPIITTDVKMVSIIRTGQDDGFMKARMK